jgi:small-conductance mechanosensitive channel
LDILDRVFYGNALSTWSIALAVGIATYVILRLLRTLLLRQVHRIAARTTTGVDDVICEAIRATRWWYLATVGIWVGAMLLALPEEQRDQLGTLAILVTLAQIGIWGVVAIRSYVAGYSRRRLVDDPASVTTIRALGFLGTVVVWVAVILVALDNLGIRVSAMIAGLGIGGIAIALAIQNILGDLFASLSIVLDKPFAYGDFIVVGDMAGTVEKVGVKTTRVRSLSGEQLVFSNSDLLQSRIRNYKRMFERRVAFGIGLVYQTPKDQVATVPGIIRGIVESLPDTRFDRAHFKTFGESSLDFEVVYYVLSSDYGVYMDRQEAINLGIMEAFEAAGIEFAYPTRTLIMEPVASAS